MKINTPVKINITSLKPIVKGNGYSVDKDIVPELVAAGAVVTGKKVENGDKIMIVNGNIEMEDIEDIFAQYDVVVDDYIETDIDMIPDYDDVEVFDSLKKNVKTKSVNEKKGDCCPPKKVEEKKDNIVNLYEALKGKTADADKKNVADLNTIIDNISGKHVSESVRNVAIEKAKAEFLKDKLGAEKYNAILESMSSAAQSMHADTKINGKRIAEYTNDELKALLKKVNEQIEALNKKVADGINEADGDKKIEETLAVKNRVKSILEDEIDFRDAMLIKEEDEAAEAPSMEFKNLNPNVSDEEAKKKDEEKTEPKNESDDDASEEESKDDENADSEDEEKNPDEDDVVELGSIVITLASEDAANELKKDLVDAGVPEDVIEIEPVEDEESDEDSEESDETDESGDETASEEETAEEPAESESPEESVKPNGKNVVNEDDENGDETASEDSENADEPVDDASAEDGSETEEETAGEDKAYKLILTDTDYVADLATVLQDIWGMEKEEFEDMIGGEIVTEDSEDKESEESSDDASSEETSSDDNGGSEESDVDDDFADFDPDEIFKDL